MRVVSVGNARKLLFGSNWAFAAFMMMFAFLIARQTECGISMYDRQTTATVTAVETLKVGKNNRKTIYRIAYTFRDGSGALHEGTSYAPTQLEGEQPVFYIHHDPDQSRLVAARTQRYGTLGFVLGMFCFLIAFGTAMMALANGRRWVHLLRHGTEVTGKETERDHIHDSKKGDRWVITFAYEHAGRPRTYKVTTTDKAFPSEVRILHEGDLATAYDEIPVDLSKEPTYSAHLLVLPVVTLGFTIATIVVTLVN